MSDAFDLQHETTLLKYPNLATFLLVYNSYPKIPAAHIESVRPTVLNILNALNSFVPKYQRSGGGDKSVKYSDFIALLEYVIATRPAVVDIQMIYSQDLLRVAFADGNIQYIPPGDLEIWEKHRGGV